MKNIAKTSVCGFDGELAIDDDKRVLVGIDQRLQIDVESPGIHALAPLLTPGFYFLQSRHDRTVIPLTSTTSVVPSWGTHHYPHWTQVLVNSYRP